MSADLYPVQSMKTYWNAETPRRREDRKCDWNFLLFLLSATLRLGVQQVRRKCAALFNEIN